MAHIYTNVENGVEGQIIESDEPLDRFEGDAKWRHTEGERSKAAEKVVEIPDGEPEKQWTIPQLSAYADREGIDLEGATKKDDVFDKITAHKAKVAGVLDHTGPSEPSAEAKAEATAEGITPAVPGK